MSTAINIIPLIDLTRLNDADDEASIITLCEKALRPPGPVAAVCVYPKFVPLVQRKLNNTSVKIATVVNFPRGDSPLVDTLLDIESAINNGANEIDMVFPYLSYINGNTKNALAYVRKARDLCQHNITLKIIIETGELPSHTLIKDITMDVIQAGADFIKTSTGKTKQGATLDAAALILKTIKETTSTTGHTVGIKISGGIRTIEQAQSYIRLASEIMGKTWVQPRVFRIGTSKLLDALLSSP